MTINLSYIYVIIDIVSNLIFAYIYEMIYNQSPYEENIIGFVFFHRNSL